MQARAAVLVLLTGMAAACSGSTPSAFAVNGSSVDSAYTCPFGANDARYDVHGTVDVSNGTSGTVTIRSVAAELTLVAVHGSWLEKLGDKYDAGAAVFTPATVAAGKTATLRVTIPSACTNGKVPSTATSYADYAVTLTIATSAGTFRTQTANRHRIIPA